MAKKRLMDDKSCYVLITCGCPKKDGSMQVEMSYEGDLDLASMMVDQAQVIFHNAIDEEQLQVCKCLDEPVVKIAK